MKKGRMPAPIGGLNTIASGMEMPPTDAVQLFNMVRSDNGLRVRLGYREWVTGLTGAGDNYVRSTLPFTGSAANGAQNKVFACTSSGIWDVTSSGAVVSAWASTTAYALGAGVTASSTTFLAKVAGTSGSTALPSVWATATVYALNARVVNDFNVYIATTGGTSDAGPTGTTAGIADGTVVWNWVSVSSAIVDGTVTWRHFPNNVVPTQVLAFASVGGRAGHGVCHVQVTSAGHFLLYWDEVNGLHVYTESTGTWAAVTEGTTAGSQIEGVNPANLVFGTVFKGRVFHVEANTAKLWYTAAGSLYGEANALDLGFKLKAGGPLVGCWNWTYDGGSSLDDALVVVSTGGDVCIYKGTDPASATTFGMDGVFNVGSMPAGRDLATDFSGDLWLATRAGLIPMRQLADGQTISTDAHATAKISSLFNTAMLTKATIAGWTMRLHPEEAAIIVTVPEAEGTATTQLAMSLSGRSWSRLRDLPIYSSNVFDGKMHFGTVDGRVCINDGYRDNVTLADPEGFTAIQYAGLTAFTDLQNPNYKQVQLIRPLFIGQSSTPSYEVAAKYDFDQSELATVSLSGSGGAGAWGTGVWGTFTWGGEYTPSMEVRGAVGMGVNAAIAWRGASADRTILVGFSVGYTEGGFL
jgi:hypothetical protein